MVQRYKKRKNLEIGGFTPEEINSFTPKELEHILQLLIKKGRMFGSFLGTDVKGQKTVAQAWLDALDIHERAPASAELPDPTLVFPVFSGMLVFLKGGAILQEPDCSFEKNIAEKFVRDAEDLGIPTLSETVKARGFNTGRHFLVRMTMYLRQIICAGAGIGMPFPSANHTL
jgi:hypothetical protein